MPPRNDIRERKIARYLYLEQKNYTVYVFYRYITKGHTV